jgi:hypothetical protein
MPEWPTFVPSTPAGYKIWLYKLKELTLHSLLAHHFFDLKNANGMELFVFVSFQKLVDCGSVGLPLFW